MYRQEHKKWKLNGRREQEVPWCLAEFSREELADKLNKIPSPPAPL